MGYVTDYFRPNICSGYVITKAKLVTSSSTDIFKETKAFKRVHNICTGTGSLLNLLLVY